MPGDLDIDPSKILIQDDASRMRKEIPFEARRPQYVRKLPGGSTGLTTAETIEHGKMFDVKRPGFIELIKSILK